MTRTLPREPKRLTTGPDNGSATTEPAARLSRTKPSAAGSRLSPSRSWGMREGQLAIANPEQPKATKVASRARATCGGNVVTPRSPTGMSLIATAVCCVSVASRHRAHLRDPMGEGQTRGE